MTVSPEQFVKSKRGHEINGWSNSGGQCVDEIREGLREVNGVTGDTFQAISPGNARDFFANANPAYFHKISGSYIRRTPSLILPEWSIVVLNHGTFGHVFNIFKGSTHLLLKGFGQNWTVARRCDYESHGLSEVMGALIFNPEMRGR